MIRSTGTVKWFSGQYGFIVPDDHTKDVFVHLSAVERAGLTTLREGERISYELAANPRNGKLAAEKLQQVVKR
jgi:cold shock protein